MYALQPCWQDHSDDIEGFAGVVCRIPPFHRGSNSYAGLYETCTSAMMRECRACYVNWLPSEQEPPKCTCHCHDSPPFARYTLPWKLREYRHQMLPRSVFLTEPTEGLWASVIRRQVPLGFEDWSPELRVVKSR